jgi:hypothetical protein
LEGGRLRVSLLPSVGPAWPVDAEVDGAAEGRTDELGEQPLVASRNDDSACPSCPASGRLGRSMMKQIARPEDARSDSFLNLWFGNERVLAGLFGDGGGGCLGGLGVERAIEHGYFFEWTHIGTELITNR